MNNTYISPTLHIKGKYNACDIFPSINRDQKGNGFYFASRVVTSHTSTASGASMVVLSEDYYPVVRLYE